MSRMLAAAALAAYLMVALGGTTLALAWFESRCRLAARILLGKEHS